MVLSTFVLSPRFNFLIESLFTNTLLTKLCQLTNQWTVLWNSSSATCLLSAMKTSSFVKLVDLQSYSIHFHLIYLTGRSEQGVGKVFVRRTQCGCYSCQAHTSTPTYDSYRRNIYTSWLVLNLATGKQIDKFFYGRYQTTRLASWCKYPLYQSNWRPTWTRGLTTWIKEWTGTDQLTKNSVYPSAQIILS